MAVRPVISLAQGGQFNLLALATTVLATRCRYVITASGIIGLTVRWACGYKICGQRQYRRLCLWPSAVPTRLLPASTLPCLRQIHVDFGWRAKLIRVPTFPSLENSHRHIVIRVNISVD